MSEPATLRRLGWVTTACGYLVIQLVRTRGSVGRFPADPGYTYLLDGADSGIRSVFFGDPYFHVVARLISILAVSLPLTWEAMATAILVHLVWVLCALAITKAISLETQSNVLAVITGLLLITAPHAAESSLGNAGNVKWPMMTALVVMCCSRPVLRTHPIRVAAVIVLTGVTQPLTVVGAIPLLFHTIRDTSLRKTGIWLLGALLTTTAAQVVRVGLNDSTSGRIAKITAPWQGMGLFWWSGLMGPLLISLAVILFTLLRVTRDRQVNTFALLLSVLSITFAFLAYRLGGIADRYFVLPMTISLIGVTVTIRDWTRHSQVVYRFALASLGALVMVPTVKWFSVSPYLASGPTWSSEIRRARVVCNSTLASSIEVELSSNGSVDLSCSRLTDD